jgi:hypothetical protein
MPERVSSRQSVLERAARIAFTFLIFNCSAVVGLWSLLTRKKVWR